MIFLLHTAKKPDWILLSRQLDVAIERVIILHQKAWFMCSPQKGVALLFSSKALQRSGQRQTVTLI